MHLIDPIGLILAYSLETETAPILSFNWVEERLVEAEKDRQLICNRCGKFITYSDEAIKFLGQHAHTCTNPHGMRFTFGCFRSAQGCAHVGDSTQRDTWFTGYSWCLANCSNCNTHLGWRFSNSSKQFHGLILNTISHSGP